MPDQIGLQAILDDSNFQAGLRRYSQGLSNMVSETERSSNVINQLGNAARNAAAVGIVGLGAAVASLGGIVLGSLNMVRGFGEQVDTLTQTFGVTNNAAGGLAAAMKVMFGNVDEGIGAFTYFTRQVATTKDQFAQANNTFKQASADAAESIATIWSEVADQRAQTEADLAERIQTIQEDLNTRLSDIAEQRSKNEADFNKSMARLDDDFKTKLRTMRSAYDRRQARKQLAQDKADLIEKYNQEQAQLAKQEAREKASAAKQIALAEKVANKQIEAAEKSAEKQVKAIEKAMKKAEEAFTAVQTQSPLSKALTDLGLKFSRISDESIPFTERLGDIAEAFSKLPDGTTKTNIALQLFGRSGIRWLDFLNLGRKGLQDFIDEFGNLGELADPSKTKAFDQALSRLQLRFDSIGLTIGSAVLPYAQDLVNILDKMVKQAIPDITAMIGRLNTAFKSGGFQGLFDQIGKELSNITSNQTFKDNMATAAQKISDFLGEGLRLVIQGAQWIGDRIGEIIKLIGDWASSPRGSVAIQNAMNQIGSAMGNALRLFIQFSLDVAGIMAALSMRFVQWSGSGNGKAWFAAIGASFASGLGEAFRGAISNVDWVGIWRAGMEMQFKISLPGQIFGLADLIKEQISKWLQGLMGGNSAMPQNQSAVAQPVINNNSSSNRSISVTNHLSGFAGDSLGAARVAEISQQIADATVRAVLSAA